MSRGPCADCLRRAWLLAALGGHIERRHRERDPLRAVLALPDRDLIDALGGSRDARVRRDYGSFDAGAARERIRAAGLRACCAHGGEIAYPPRLCRLPDSPSVLHVGGDPHAVEAMIEAVSDAEPARGGCSAPCESRAPAGGGGAASCEDEVPAGTAGAAVAIVGARRASPYGLGVARSLGRGAAAAGLPVISGMALGADSAAHEGALATGGVTVAVLAAGAERAYPASKARLHRRLLARGVVVSELPPGTPVHRWAFPARNRLIAALSAVTVVVEAAERSGSLITAEFAADLGAAVAAVPGQVTSPLSAGTNALLRDGAEMVRDARDLLELALGSEAVARHDAGSPAPALPPALAALREDLARGRGTVADLVAAGRSLADVLSGLAELELLGAAERAAGGRYVPIA